jgi:hypothetical protein
MATAIAAGSDKVALCLLERDIDFFGKGEEILKAAAAHGRDDLIHKMMKKGLRADAGDNAAMIEALDRNHFPAALALMAGGGAIDARNGQALYNAIEREDIDCVNFILANKGDPNRIRGGESMLSFAVQAEDTAIVDALITAGANPEKNKYDAVRKAARYEEKEILKKFSAAARRIRADERIVKQKELAALFPEGYSLDDLRLKKGASGESGLLIAAQTGNFAEILRAASGGSSPKLLPADLYHPDEGIDTVLSMLVRHKSLQQFFDASLWSERLEEAQQAHSLLPKNMQRSVGLDGIEAAMKIKRAEDRMKKILPKKPKR